MTKCLLAKVMEMPRVEPDLLIHDDACHFQSYVQKHDKAGHFKDIKYWVVDVFHAPNHRCEKRTWTKKEQRRCSTVRTNVAESFNAWIRTLNFFANGLRPHSRRFWIREAILFYNEHLRDVPVHISRRTNVKARSRLLHKKPAAKAVAKKPAAKVKVARKKPSAKP